MHTEEVGPLFKATEAREREKEVTRMKAELGAAELTSQQVGEKLSLHHASR